MAKEAKDLFLQVMGRDSLEGPGPWRALFEAIDEHAPRWTPVKWDQYEPLRRKWAGADEACAAQGILARAAHGQAELEMGRRASDYDAHASFELGAVGAGVATERVVPLLQRACSAMDADYGFLHLLHPPAWGQTRPRYVSYYNDEPWLLVPPWVLQLYLPGIYWATVLGPAYVDLFGEELLRSAPCHVAEEYEPGRFYLQMTPELGDCRDDYLTVVEAAEAVMDHLGRDAFVDPDRYREPGRAPDFRSLRRADPPRPFVPLQP